MIGKTIIHQKYDMDEISLEQVQRTHDMLKAVLPEDYIVLSTPTDITKVQGDSVVTMIEAKPYTASELIEIVEKAWMHDELSR